MDNESQERRRRVRRTAIMLTVIALAFYVGFILLTIHRSR
jgi:uncharacterized membrane protein (DUF485 family)